MVSNLLCWIPQLPHTFERSTWFHATGFRRLFLEALEQTLSRLPYPRIFNWFNTTDFLEEVIGQSREVKLLADYAWQTHPVPAPYDNRRYLAITTHWGMSHKDYGKAFILGKQDVSESKLPGASEWKYNYWQKLPRKCFKLLQRCLPCRHKL